MFLQVSVILFWGGGGIPACIVGLQAHTQGGGGGELRGLAWGGLQAHTQGGELKGLAWGGGFHAHTQGEVSRPTPGGYPSMH